MKSLLLATITAFSFTTAASAMDLGGGLSAGATADAHWDVDAEDWAATLTPYAGYTLWGVALSAETELNLRNIDFTGLDLTAEYALPVAGFTPMVYGTINADADFNFSGAKVGVEFKF
jgi:opacity protein-like surface antigen